MKILCPEPSSFSFAGLSYARQYGNVCAREMAREEFEAEAPGYDAVLIRFNTRVSARVMQGRLRAILSPTTGLDHIDIGAAQRRKVLVYHLRGQKRFLSKIPATAELTIALMLSVLRNLPQAVDTVRRGYWQPGPFRGREVSGKTLGIIGCGRLGSQVARICRAMGMRVVAFDPYIQRLPKGVEKISSLQNLLGVSDVVSIHLPLLPETKHLISRQEFSQCKVGAILINTSRGAIVDSEALVVALETGALSAAALDVIEDEERVAQQGRHLLIDYARDHTNLLITPHIGGATFESVEKTDLFILRRYFRDQGVPISTVDF